MSLPSDNTLPNGPAARPRGWLRATIVATLAIAFVGAAVGFVGFLRLIRNFQPLLAVHGHIHPYGRTLPERRIGSTRVINVVPSRLIDV